MKFFAITAISLVLAVLSVLSTRLIIPALELIFRYIEQSFAPTEPEPLLVLAPSRAVPVTVTPSEVTPITKATPKKRATRKRTPAKSKTAPVVEA